MKHTTLTALATIFIWVLHAGAAEASSKPKPNPPKPAPVESALPAPGLYNNANGSPLLPLLEGATSSIDIEIYTMSDKTVRADIRAALARGVKVRILKDPSPYGQTCDPFSTSKSASSDCADQQKLVSDVRAAGGTYDPFNKTTLCPNGGGSDGQGCYEHGKIAIVDGNVALISTGNFDDTNLCIDGATQCDRDYTLIDDDAEVVGALEKIFETDLVGVSYDVGSLIPADLQASLFVSPISLQPIVNFLQSAQTSIEVETQYLEDPTMNAALTTMAKKGVKVSVTVASICAFGKPDSADAAAFQSTYSSFDSAGISSAMFNAANKINGKRGYLHAKAIIIDGTRAWIGSENGSTESMTENREYGLVFTDPNWVANLKKVVEGDHSSPNSETWQDSLNCSKDGSGVSGN